MIAKVRWYWQRLWRRPHTVYTGDRESGVIVMSGREAGLSGQSLFVARCYYWWYRWTGVPVKRWEVDADGFPLLMSAARKTELQNQAARHR